MINIFPFILGGIYPVGNPSSKPMYQTQPPPPQNVPVSDQRGTQNTEPKTVHTCNW